MLKFFYRNPYRLDITLIIILKLILLGCIWYFCFSQPIADKLDRTELVQHFNSVIQEKT